MYWSDFLRKAEAAAVLYIIRPEIQTGGARRMASWRRRRYVEPVIAMVGWARESNQNNMGPWHTNLSDSPHPNLFAVVLSVELTSVRAPGVIKNWSQEM